MAAAASAFLASLPIASEATDDAVGLALDGVTVRCLISRGSRRVIVCTCARASRSGLSGRSFAPSCQRIRCSGAIAPCLGVYRKTRTQGRNLLGVDDSTCFDVPFGVFVADEFQKIQLVIIAGCMDDTSTRQGLQRWLDWMSESGEERTIAQRARRRALIVRAVQKANE